MLCDYTAGLVAGLVSVFIGHPLDTIKIQQQVRSLTVKEATRRIITHRGWKGFYRGLTAPIISTGTLNAFFFGIYGDVRDYLVQRRMQGAGYTALEKQIRNPTYTELFISGTVAGAITTCIAAPIDLVKTKLQSQMKRTMFVGPKDVILTLSREAGVRGFFRGFAPLMWRDGPGGGFYVVAYEGFKEVMRKVYGPTSKSTESIIAGGLSGAVNWVVVLPFDTIKSRMQADDHKKPHYRNMIHVVKEIRRTDGIIGLYRGFWSVSIRAFPVNASIFLVYEYLQTQLCERTY